MKSKKRNLSLIPFFLAALFAVIAVGGSATFARFYGEYEKKKEAGVAVVVAKLETNSVYRTDSEGMRISVAFDPTSESTSVKDVEPEDVIDYYFTITGADGRKENEVSMKVTLVIRVRLEMIIPGENVIRTCYFAGWKNYTAADGVRSGGSLKLYHGAEGENETDIRPSIGGGEEVDFSGNKLSVSNNADGSIDNKTGLLMTADDDKKDHAYHIRFRLPEQSSVTESYAGAKVYFDIGIIAEQIRN